MIYFLLSVTLLYFRKYINCTWIWYPIVWYLLLDFGVQFPLCHMEVFVFFYSSPYKCLFSIIDLWCCLSYTSYLLNPWLNNWSMNNTLTRGHIERQNQKGRNKINLQKCVTSHLSWNWIIFLILSIACGKLISMWVIVTKIYFSILKSRDCPVSY